MNVKLNLAICRALALLEQKFGAVYLQKSLEATNTPKFCMFFWSKTVLLHTLFVLHLTSCFSAISCSILKLW